MTTETEAVASEATAPAEMKTKAVPSAFAQEPSEPPTPAEAAPEEPTETPEAQAATDDPDDDEAGAAEPEKAPLPKGIQRKINKLTRRVGESSETIRELQERLAQYESGQVQEKPTEPTVQASGDEPKPEDYDFDMVAFNRAHFTWLRESEKKQEEITKRRATFAEKEAAFKAKHPDYDDVAKSPDVPITRSMAEIILGSDEPPAIAYYLGNNPDEAHAISQMPPIAQARAIGRIEAKLAEAPAPTPVPPKKTTNAPPPPKTVSGAGQPSISVDAPDITPAQRIALWRKQRGKT